DRPVYTAHCKHPIQTPYLPQFESGQGVVAVRVDPEDPQNVALDLTNQPPPPRDGGSDVSAVTGAPVDVGASADITAAVQAALDAPPELRQGALSAAEVLATGTPCRVIIQAAQPLGFQKKGLDVWGLTVNAIVDGEAPSQAGIGLGVPPEAMALVFPGANLPGARRSDVTDAVCIDWAAAVAAAPH
ncbi:MAG: hypothetical protein JWM71_1054, partial [Solirubrobacteraceae bacterium]|nr:hypothetical protein [Solirubrobacteraceae bacterium]